jgi:hypothetical protein
MGSTGVDVLLSTAAKSVFPVAVECINLAKIAVYQYYEQAKANAGKETPVVVIKQNRSEPLVVLSLEDFMKLFPDEDSST